MQFSQPVSVLINVFLELDKTTDSQVPDVTSSTSPVANFQSIARRKFLWFRMEDHRHNKDVFPA